MSVRYGIPLLGDRVAPRCPFADSILLASNRRDRFRVENRIPSLGLSIADLTKLLSEHRVDTLVCCGITLEEKEFIQNHSIDIIDNVACSADEAMRALESGVLRSGFGFSLMRSDSEAGDALPGMTVEETSSSHETAHGGGR